MDPQNDRFRAFLGVTAWHKAGYTGRRGLTVTGENPGIGKSHAASTEAVFHEIAPDRELVYMGEPGQTFVVGDAFEAVMAAVLERKADTMFMSYEGHGERWDEYSADVMPFCSIFCAAGNDGDDEYIARIACQNIYGVGAYSLMAGTSAVSPAYYSSVSEYVDFCAPAMLWVDGGPFAGTSCAAPVLAGMAALVNDLFLDKTGKPLSSAMMYQFMQDHCRDVGAAGKDGKCGWGAPILPAPETIQIERYAGEMYNSREIGDLRADVAANCRKMIAIAKADGWPILVTGTVRDKAYQEYCYYKGTSKSKTPTFHGVNAGLAFDICKNVKGEEYSDAAFWAYVGALGKRLGYTWGGDWTSIVDKPHFQWDAHKQYTGSMILAGKLPPDMPLYEEDEDMTKAETQDMIDAAVKAAAPKVYTSIDEVPVWAKGLVQRAMAAGVLAGDEAGKLCLNDANLVNLQILSNLGLIK